jgi:hypothetical protein
MFYSIGPWSKEKVAWKCKVLDEETNQGVKSYKTFYGSNLQMFEIS